MNTGKVLLGVLTGMAAGAILGILFAPDKGEETRKMIAKKSEDYSDSFTEKLNEYMDDVTQKFEQVKRSITEMKDKSFHHN